MPFRCCNEGFNVTDINDCSMANIKTEEETCLNLNSTDNCCEILP